MHEILTGHPAIVELDRQVDELRQAEAKYRQRVEAVMQPYREQMAAWEADTDQANEHDSSAETHAALEAAVKAAAGELDHDGDVLVTGYAMIGEYMTEGGEHWWTIRYEPGTGEAT